MNAGLKVFNEIEEKFLSLTFIVVIVVIFLQVVLRELGMTNSWSEELARYLYIWECWVGVSYCERYDAHIRITFFVDKFSKKVKKNISILADTICLIFALVLGYFGVELILHLMEFGTRSPGIHIPMWIVYASLPVGCLLYAIRLSHKIVAAFTGKEVVEEWK